MILIKIIGKMIALPMILIFGSLYLLMEGMAKVYSYAAGFVLNMIIICSVLAIITSQWTALLIFGILLAALFISVFAAGVIMAYVASGRDYFVSVLHG